MKSNSLGFGPPPPKLVNTDRRSAFHLSSVAVLPFIYVFDEVLNGLLGTNFGSALLLLLWTGILALQSGEVIRLRSAYLIFFVVVVMASLVAYAVPSGCHVEAKGAASLMLLGVLTAFFSRMNLTRIVQDDRTASLILVLVLVSLAVDVVGLGIRSVLFGFSKGSGPYSEASHLAVYLLPVIAVRMVLTPRNNLTWAVLLAALVLAPSSTLLLGVIGALGIFLIRGSGGQKRWLWMLSVFALVALLGGVSGAVDLSQTANRITHLFGGFDAEVANHENLSAIVWLNGWSQAADTLSSSNWLGAGFNQMGCGPFSMAGFFSPLMFDTFGVVLNVNDGSLLAAKLIAELGVVGLGIVLIFSVKSVAAILASRNTGAARDAGDRLLATIRAVGGLTVLMYLFVRGMGYFQIPILLGLAMLLVSRQGYRARCDQT